MRKIDVAASRCKDWLSSQVLPLWAECAVRSNGVFEEGLQSDGQPFEEDLIRFRVQPRQTYVFAHATELGWFDGAELVKNAVDNGFDHFRCETGEFVFSTSKDLVINNESKNAYEHAFAMLGYAWHFKLTKEESSLENAETYYNWFESALADSENGGFFSSTDDKSLRSQNPHMHLFEALMTLYEVSGKELWLERASKIYGLFCTKFFNGTNLIEFFDGNLEPNHELSENIDPGHQYEWIWLLNHYEHLTGIDVSEQIAALKTFAEKYGHSELGLVMDEIKDTGAVYRNTSRLWCQTELLKARIALFERNPSEDNESAVADAVALIFKHYLDNANKGSWVDQVNADGNPVSMNSPASTLYHIFLAMAEVYRVAKK
ncbi:AGE family epimerase/isomerase [Vibrio aestuarianus]|uniref:AGE family epimerase/isomerase n=1 Tax=Vibrio aestuarianus TaxID=28171 RepID=A0A9X4IXU8_9VIBR|nr:AGE family epimerase/isomerase [Vibrio aestuarianus]MDE1236024.1 AGE family epimerase/isomerase [Vibrio aestuarianus]MDE1246902.1 AGE family epimerase/isomerase [Vibrio aestuarianus]MDE1315157.1 AGE family epimerase/isomerase [Vibrio aestuarianus]MDE1347503.1 AGE family epimerase/isomerase [Vibrio aestuarianus]NGZ64230.1 mannose-6-phosphate isomerase [Vibrio aestuarianus subsp. cardii]